RESILLLVESARGAVTDERVPLDDRLAAVALLGWNSEKRNVDVAILARLLGPQYPSRLQSAALKALGRIRVEGAAKVLLDTWPARSTLRRTHSRNNPSTRTRLSIPDMSSTRPPPRRPGRSRAPWRATPARA